MAVAAVAERAERRPRGRGATASPAARYLDETRGAFDDGWTDADPLPERIDTRVTVEQARRIISSNDSPDVPFERSINPYRGCEHGCVYCFARPTHAWLDLSPGLDFESRLVVKSNAAECLEQELAAPGYRPKPIALGANTDAYQPIEREHGVTRAVIATLLRCRHPFLIITKSALVERDLDLLAEAAAENLVRVHVSLTTLERGLARSMEPRAASPERRLRTIARLARAGVPAGVLTAPIIPALNDHEVEALLAASAEAGAECAGYVLLRLPLELREMFADWLRSCLPLRAEHVLSRLRGMRGGAEYQSGFGTRMRGTGEDARLLAQRFERQCRRLGLAREGRPLDCDRFRPPGAAQLALF